MIRVFSDRLGIVPLFVSHQGDRFVVASSLRECARHVSHLEFDFDALAVFLRLGYFLGADTPFTQIKVVSPNTEIHVSAGSVHFEQKSNFPKPSMIGYSRASVAAHYCDLLESAIFVRRLERRLGLPLTGGRDSRHLLLAMNARNVLPDVAVTCGRLGEFDPDVLVARQLADLYGVPHVTNVPAPPFSVRRERDKNANTSYLTDEHQWVPDVSDELKRQRVQLVFDGIGGDVLSNGLMFTESLLAAFRKGDGVAVADRLMAGRTKELPHLSERLQLSLSWERAKERIRREAAKFYERPNPVLSFIFENRTRREIALAPVCLLDKFEVAMPYLDEDIVAFLQALPAEDYGRPGFHDETIAARYPASLAVPYGGKLAKGARLLDRNRTEAGAYWTLVVAATKNGIGSATFCVPRLASLVATGRAQAEWWWIQQLAYMADLERLRMGD